MRRIAAPDGRHPAVCQEPAAKKQPASGKGACSFSGIYPHLAHFNSDGECGTGAVVPWAGRLWW
ncbi:MAG: hypothetical protein U0736_13765 [Gemmataceae bacterium]